MNAAYAALVTGVVSSQNPGTSTACAGRSLSSAHGSADVPMVNGPPGTCTSAGSAAASAGAGGGGGADSTAGPDRSWWVASMVSSCCTSCCATIPNANPAPTALGAEAAGRARRQLDLLDEVEHAAADLVAVAARLGRGEQRQGRPLGARVLERVVQRVDLRVHRVAAADRAQQPELLLVGDVRQVPHERRHQRGVLLHQVGVVDGGR